MIPELMNTEYMTKDLHLAAYLKLKGAELLRVEKPTTYKSPSFFVFANKEKCESLNKLFWEAGDYINVKEYINVIHDLRSRVSAIPYEAKS